MRWSVAGFQGKPPGDKTMCSMDPATRDFHIQTGMAAIPYNSQAGGFFSKLDFDAKSVERNGNYTAGNVNVFDYLKNISQDLGVSISQIVLAYFWAQPFVSIPIIGCRNQEQLEDSLLAVDCKLPKEVTQKIHELTIS